MLDIYIDNKIPFIRGILEKYAEVHYFNASSTYGADSFSSREDINAKELWKADVLIVRTRTKCTQELLEGSNIKCIISATIGTDHINLKYCIEKGIKVYSAAGCNSGGVMQYVFTCLYYFAHSRNIDLSNKTLGVVGVGNVGSKVANLGEMLGFKLMRNDPFKLHEPCIPYYELEELAENCDIITFHVPLTALTKGMINEKFLVALKRRPVIINSSRGDIVDTASLLRHGNMLGGLVLDVWPGEPEINGDLLELADIASPHIAGYSLEGKINATVMSVRNLAEFAGIKELAGFTAPSDWYGKSKQIILNTQAGQNDICNQLLDAFPVYELDELLRKTPENFESIRSNYVYRREFSVNFNV